MKTFYRFFLTGSIIVWSVPYAAGHQVAPSYCDPEYFESENSMETPPPLEESLESLADLKIYSTSDFFTLKREEGLPDGIPNKPLREYPELQGKWNNLWDRVHAIRLTRGEKIEKRRKVSPGELQALVTKMVNEFDRKDIPEEEFPEENASFQEERVQEISSLTISRSFNNQNQTAGKPPAKIEIYNDEYPETPQKAIEPVHYNPQEERKERLLALTAENPKITRAEIAEKMGLSIRTIIRTISRINRRNSWLGQHPIIINNGKTRRRK